MREETRKLFLNLQEDLCKRVLDLENALDPAGVPSFRVDKWKREVSPAEKEAKILNTGGGDTRVLVGGKILERGGGNFSEVAGLLPLSLIHI